MKLLLIDGNSIMNRAFYGIKILTTKDGRFTNAIYGFMSILNKLLSDCEPDAVAVAFDVKKPTFRHKMYADYKAGRKPMPEELKEQMPVLKELLALLGYKTVEKEGWEADDIIGTLSAVCRGEDRCFIATGDRDSLQLVSENTSVLLTSTKFGKTRTVVYTPEKIKEEYSVTPAQMIEIKALQGDSSDNIPGVAGIGPKTAIELISQYGSIDEIYDKIDVIEIRDKLREKLVNGRESAYMSRELGTISLDAPVDRNPESYVPAAGDRAAAVSLLSRLEMFSIIEKFGLDKVKPVPLSGTQTVCMTCEKTDDLSALKDEKEIYACFGFAQGEIDSIAFCRGNTVYFAENDGFMFADSLFSALSDKEKTVYTCSVKSVYNWALRHNFDLKCSFADVSVAAYVLNPSANDYSPLRLKSEYGIGVETDSDNETVNCAAVMKELSEVLLKEIRANGQEYLFFNIEMPLTRVLSAMETEGFLVDIDSIDAYGKVLGEKISELEAEIYSLTGEEFNLNSPKQLGTVLFEKMGLPCRKKTKSGYSTNADVLEELSADYPVVALILSYRTLSKLKSTYCDGLKKCISSDGRIHSTLNQTETRTGRISSTEPNLQNIPVRSEVGRELRKFFIAKPGCVLIDADYSQIELRVLAHIADDENMENAFNSGQDIHTITASQVFNMPVPLVTPQMRSRAKAVNFGIVYGIGAFSLAKDIGVTRKQADSYIKGYLNNFSGVNRYMESVIEQAKENGYVSTVFNRRRYLPELNGSNAVLRKFGERVARNMPIQGTAADIIKIAMVRVYDRLERQKLGARLIMQVHDELIIEAPERERDEVCRLLKEEMENAYSMKVKLIADVHCGRSWYETK